MPSTTAVQHDRSVRAWLLYDVASSTYAAVVPSVLFALHFTANVAAGRPDAAAIWGTVSAAALLVAGVIAPFVGAWADSGQRRARLLAAFTLLCCVATATLAWPARGQIVFAALLFVAAQSGYIVATALYDAYLQRLAPDARGADRLSSRGWALGYVGGMAVLLLLMVMPQDGNGAPAPAVAFPVIALLFAGIAIPAIAGLRGVVPVSAVLAQRRHPWRQVAHTLAHWREHRGVVRFLVASYLINDAMVTVGAFVAIYLRDHFGMRMSDVLWLTFVFHAIALPATWAFGSLALRSTPRRATAISIGVWIVAIVLLAFGSGRAAAVLVVVLLATVFGSTQALLRGMYARIVPPAQAAEFFGFNALAGRLSAVLGPLTMAAIAVLTGSAQIAILSMALFLVAGGVLLWRDQGMVAARG